MQIMFSVLHTLQKFFNRSGEEPVEKYNSGLHRFAKVLPCNQSLAVQAV